MSTASAQLTPERLQRMNWGFAPPIIIECAIRHRIFDVLDGGAKTVEQVGAETGASARGLRAIMNALVGLELLQKQDGETYALTPESAAFLVRSKPGFQGGMLRHVVGSLIPNWLHLTEVAQTGRPSLAVNQQPSGSAFFQELVVDIMAMNRPAAQALASHLAPGERPIRVLDLAAGSGVWGLALAQAGANVEVTAVDWPDVIRVTRKVVAEHGHSKQFRFIEGDLLTAEFGENFDVAILGHILHSEGAARSRELLAKVVRALRPGGTVAIAEFLVNRERTAPPVGLFFAVNMLVHTEAGETFAFEEIAEWLATAGFAGTRTLEVPGPSPLILAERRG